MGFFEVKLDGKVIREGETFTCAHCNKPIEIERGAPVAMCTKEMKRICMPCEMNPRGCRPFQVALEKVEARDRLLRSMGLR